MSEVLTTIQQQINYQYEQLAYFENLYNQSIVKTNQALALLNSCLNGKRNAFLGFYSCKNNQGASETDLRANYTRLSSISSGYLRQIREIKKEIDRLNLELELYTDQVEDLTDLTVDISNADRVINDNERNIGVETFKKYAIPLIILALVFFGVYVIRKRG